MSKSLHQMTPEELGKLFPIQLCEYNPAWIDKYQQEKHNILSRLDDNTINRIDHIGSTAIPNLISKPTIDILLQVEELTDLQMLIQQITSLDYEFVPQPENPPPHMMFAKGYSLEGFSGQAFHIHVRYPGDWDEILFRDYLQLHPKMAAEYGKLKTILAEKYRNDRDKYTRAKTDFVVMIIKKGRKTD